MDESEKIIPFDRKRSAIQQQKEYWTTVEQHAADMLTAGILEIEQKHCDSFYELLGGLSEIHCHINNGKKVFEVIYPYEPNNVDGAETIAYAIIELIKNIEKFTKVNFHLVPSCAYRNENE